MTQDQPGEPVPNGEPTPEEPIVYLDDEAADAGTAAEPPRAADLDPVVTFVLPAHAEEAVATTGALAPRMDVAAGRDPETLAAIDALGARLEKRLADLQNAFDREIRAESTREKVVDRLHAELQDYKQDLLLNTLRPVFIDLIQLHDDIGKVAVVRDDEAGAEGSAAVRRLLGFMIGFQQGIEDILYRQGVEPFHVEGEAFDPRRQRAISTLPCDDPSLNKTVAARQRKGFRAGDRVIRPELVSVYALKKT